MLLSRFRFRFPKELTQRYDFILNYQKKYGKSFAVMFLFVVLSKL